MIVPACHAPVKESEAVIGISFTVLQPPTEKSVSARNFTRLVRRVLLFRLQLCTKLLAEPFICVQTQYPLVRRLIYGKLFLLAIPQPFLMQHPCPGLFGDRNSMVGAARIHDQNFVGYPNHRFYAAGNVAGFVAGYNDS